MPFETTSTGTVYRAPSASGASNTNLSNIDKIADAPKTVTASTKSQTATGGGFTTTDAYAIPVSAPKTTALPTTPTAAPAAAADAAAPSTISVETGTNGTSTPVSVTTTKQVVGAANASDDAATNAAAKKALDAVDAELASKLGSKYAAPATQQDRVKLVAQVVSNLNVAAKTAFLNKIGALGKDFGLDFGQPSISTSTDKMTPAQKQIKAALYTEWQTGQPFSKDVKSTDTSTQTQTNSQTDATTSKDDSNSELEGTPLAGAELSQGALNIVATVKSLGFDREAVRNYFAAQDTSGDGKLSETELIKVDGQGVDAVTWNSYQQRTLMSSRGTTSVDQVTDRAIAEAKKYYQAHPQP
jgi:hypothetical protein